jgi:hypothetical protein
LAKFGEGHAAAMFRLGFKELRNALNPSRESAADSEIGLYGTQTQGEIAQARGSHRLDLEEETPRGTYHDRLTEAASRGAAVQQHAKGIER